MTKDRELADALLTEDGSGSRRVNVDAILRRERNRVRWWGALTASLWIATAGYVAFLGVAYLVYVQPQIAAYMAVDQDRQMDTLYMERILVLIAFGLKAFLVWPVLLCLAAAGTTLFVLASRRATLREIQRSLVSISEQVRILAQNR
jgi:hypothetical protein